MEHKSKPRYWHPSRSSHAPIFTVHLLCPGCVFTFIPLPSSLTNNCENFSCSSNSTVKAENTCLELMCCCFVGAISEFKLRVVAVPAGGVVVGWPKLGAPPEMNQDDKGDVLWLVIDGNLLGVALGVVILCPKRKDIWKLRFLVAWKHLCSR